MEEMVRIFQDNLGNRLTVALANGMIAEIAKHIPKEPVKEPENDNDSAADSDITE